MVVRPRFSTEIEPFELDLPAGKKIGGVIAADFTPEGDLLVLHQSSAPGREVPGLDLSAFLPDVTRFHRRRPLHRFRAMQNGDLLLCCTGSGLKRLKYLGTS